jgi:hypothetical protein
MFRCNGLLTAFSGIFTAFVPYADYQLITNEVNCLFALVFYADKCT